MEVSDESKPVPGAAGSRDFFPSGAICFFALLLLFYAAVWGVIYLIMIARS